MKKLPLHSRILIGMCLGILWGLLASNFGWVDFTIDWIKPFGSIFVNLLKLVAVPLVLVTIILGISSLSDLAKLTRIGTQTLVLFFSISLICAVIGLLFAASLQPGKYLSAEKRDEIKLKYADDVGSRMGVAEMVKDAGPLQIIEDLVPGNIFFASQDNRNMLQVIFFAILFGLGIVLSPKEKVQGVISFFDGVNEVILKMVNIIMKYAPIGVFALIGALIVDMAGNNPADALAILKVLGIFALVFIAALLAVMFGLYPILVRSFTRFKYLEFLRALVPAQLLAFSTSSSAATLPITLECTEKNLKVREEIAGFVLPLGITINMHGTAVHQAVSAVFIAQAFGHDLTLTQYAIVAFTSVLASMGAPAVPGAGIIMQLMVLGAIGVEAEGLALILAVDRPLDMLRTIPNVVGDALVASIIDKREMEQ
ncbi:dicarboxylate/amino acid:cation symporter [uncultured Imperialibacter sp.]|uniref:dicarboxylate/amino acid:cation symporter n=1 Tax=uncultured Imperialibacter sp. TaxID=1672639 RepID=UPI0030DBF77F|tara:strand:- start:44771 stop:46048 length:1278 start_codon:yes stop_codon:yes gene_type:complete